MKLLTVGWSAAVLLLVGIALAVLGFWNFGPDSGFLGVSVKGADGSVVLTKVEPGSPAARAGLRKDDVLVSMHGKKINDAGDFEKTIRELQAGDSVGVTVRRNLDLPPKQVTLAPSAMQDGQIATLLQVLGVAALVVSALQSCRVVNGWQKMIEEI
jgi:predicted metalloprotease with PDZ domain